MREADYTSFIKNWIGKTIEVQAYAIDTAPDDSTLMKKTVKIKGFLFPITWDYMEDYLKNEGSILMNKEAVADCMQPNTMIQSVYFHSEKETDMRKALQYLRQHPTYSAFFQPFPPAAVFRCRSQKNELSAIYQRWCCHAAFHRPAGAICCNRLWRMAERK